MKVKYLSKEEMLKDLEGVYFNPHLIDDEELEIKYNNEFYSGFYGVVYKLKEEGGK